MLRDTSIFICDNCEHIFKALDIEYNCMALSAPQKCPKCGSYHTMPVNDLDFPGKTIYERIWEKQDKTGNHNVTCYYPSDILAKSLKEREEWNSQDHTEEFKKKLKNGCLDYKEKPIEDLDNLLEYLKQ